MEAKEYKILEDDNFKVVLEKFIELEIPEKYTIIRLPEELLISRHRECNHNDEILLEKIYETTFEVIPMGKIERIKIKKRCDENETKN